MSPRLATPPAGLLARGVHVCPYLGPDGELVLVAVTSTGRRLCDPVTIPHGADRVGAADALWARLESEDPVPILRAC